MKISLVLLVISLCGAFFTEARRNYGRRYDHMRQRPNLLTTAKPADDDRGDEYRELNTPLPLLEEKANLPDEQIVVDASETPNGFNTHTVETAEVAVTSEQPIFHSEIAVTTEQPILHPQIAITTEEPILRAEISVSTEQPNLHQFQKDFEDSLTESRNNAQKYGSSLGPLTVRGYGFKFSSVIPQDIRYTIEKEVPLTEPGSQADHFDLSTVSYGKILEQQPTIGEVEYGHALTGDLVPPAFDFNIQSTPIVPIVELQENEGPDSHGDTGLNIGSGLRSIAQGSADQAENAVISQHVAAQQAAFVAKNALAQSAIHSAATAIAALAGKEVLVHSLERQTEEIREQLDNELKQLQITKKTNAAARHAAQQAAYHVSVLAAALNNAHQAAQHAENNEKSAASELAAQTQMVGDAKGHLDSIAGRLEAANIDFEATKEAAAKATEAAEEAHRNANSVGEQVSPILLREDSILGHQHDIPPAYTLH